MLQYYFSPTGKRFRSRTEVRDGKFLLHFLVCFVIVADDVVLCWILYTQIAREYGLEVKKVKRSTKEGAKTEAQKHVPLSREQSREAAVAFAAEHGVPLRLLRDVKIVQFGTPSKEFSTEDSLVMVNFRARWTDTTSKVVFESRIELTGGDDASEQALSFNVYAIDSTESGKKLRYPVGKGSSPDDVWNKVAERQKHILLRDRKAQDGLALSPSSKMSPVDCILKKVCPLANVWGLEKFGLIDLTCLKAMEGQDGVEDTCYKYVNERSGWVQEQVKIRELLGKRGQKMRLKPRASKSHHAATNRAVERVMDSLLKKVCAWHDKMESRLAKQKEKELQKEKKRQEKEKKRLERKGIKRDRVTDELEDDLELPGCNLMPPEPLPASSALHKSCHRQKDVEIVMEAWTFADRFHSLLGIDRKTMPTVQDMLRTYYAASGGSDICGILGAMIDFLVGEACEDAISSILKGDPDLRRVDFVPPTRNAHMISRTDKNWQEVLHRYLYTVAISAGLFENSSMHCINYPLDNVHPYHIIDSMTSGPTLLELSICDLNPLLSDESEQRIVARRDALARYRATKTLAITEEQIAENDRLLRLALCKLYSVSTECGGTLWDTCFLGPEAALEARIGYPIDLSHIISRVECLVYQKQEDCWNSFASDLCFVCKILQVACWKGNSKLGTDKAIAKKEAVLKSILQFLRECADLYQSKGVIGLLGKLEAEVLVQDLWLHDDTKSTPRNVPPPPGTCFICWVKGNQDDFVACGSCNMLAHPQCLKREWMLGSCSLEEPSDLHCLLCCHSENNERWNMSLKGPCGALWETVRSLNDEGFDQWDPSTRLDLLHLVTLLVAESPAVRDSLEGENERHKKVRLKLAAARNELRTVQQQIRKEQGEEHSHRSLRDCEARREKLIIQVSALEQQVRFFDLPRKSPLGLDRHWNRYWSMPAEAFDNAKAMVVVEQNCASHDTSTEPKLGLYCGPSEIKNLIDFLNVKGRREKSLREKLTSWVESAASHAQAAMAVDEESAAQETNPTTPLPHKNIAEFLAALLEYAESLPEASYHEVRGCKTARVRWNSFANSVQTVQEAMAAIVLLENMIDLSCYKVHWRLWAIPIPDPTLCCTLSSVWNRFENLRKAIKHTPNHKYSLSMLHVEEIVGEVAEELISRGLDGSALTDQEYARQLDAELNQRRTAASGSRRRNWQISSPRDRARRSNHNLRQVSNKFYGEDGSSDGDDQIHPAAIVQEDALVNNDNSSISESSSLSSSSSSEEESSSDDDESSE